MVGSRDTNRLLQLARAANAKVVLVGDAEQLQAIDAGGAFRALRERHGAVEITTIRRQHADWQREATANFFRSYTDEALDAYKQRGHIQASDCGDTARRKMIAAWTDVRRNQPEKTQLMMAFTRADVHDLNMEARAIYRQEGRLSGADAEIKTTDGTKAFARGDRLYFLKNDIRLGVMNGSLGTVDSIFQHLNGNGHRIRVKLDGGKDVVFDTSDYANISHGFACTVHKAQGATVDRSHVLASSYMDRHSAYVAMTRHREQVNLHYAETEFRDYRALVRDLSRDNRKDTTLDYLDRAEAKGQARSIWESAVKRIVDPVARMKELVASYKSKDAREAWLKKQDAEEAAETLRNALGKHKEKRPGISAGLSF